MTVRDKVVVSNQVSKTHLYRYMILYMFTFFFVFININLVFSLLTLNR